MIHTFALECDYRLPGYDESKALDDILTNPNTAIV